MSSKLSYFNLVKTRKQTSILNTESGRRMLCESYIKSEWVLKRNVENWEKTLDSIKFFIWWQIYMYIFK